MDEFKGSRLFCWSRPLSALYVPQAEAAEKSVEVISKPAMRRQFLELLGISPAQNNFVRLEGLRQLLDDVRHMFAPFLFAAFFQRARSPLVFICCLSIGE